MSESSEKPFSIYSFITEVRKDAWDLTAVELTKLVMAELPPEHQQAAFEQCLRHTVAGQLSGPKSGRPYLRPVPEPAASGPGRPPNQQPQPQTSRDSARSWKTAASRRAWQTHLEDPFHVIPGSPEFIRFGDCRVDDLVQAIRKRRDAADALQATASALEEWSQLLVKHGVRRVRELPESVLRARLDRGAA